MNHLSPGTNQRESHATTGCNEPSQTLRQAAESQLENAVSESPDDTGSMTHELLQIAVHELRVHQIELEMQNEELRRAQFELDASRARYFDLYELAPVGYCTVSESGLILEANLTASALLGVDRTSLVNLPISQFIDHANQDVFYRHRQLLINSDEPQSCEVRMIRSDGTAIWMRLLSRVATVSDGSIVLRVAMSDVTEAKQTEFGLLESERRFAYVLEATREGIWDWNIATNNVYYSPQWARLLGFESAELQPHVDTFFSLLHPDDQEGIQNQIHLHFSGLIPEKQSEIRLRTKSGEYRWFLDRGKVVTRDTAGNPIRMVGSIKDIHERKQTEKARTEAEAWLREREARLRKAQAISKIGNFHWNAATDAVEWSEELFRIYGREPNSFTPSFAGCIEAIHPDDRSTVMQTLQKVMGCPGEFDHEYRVIRPDGSLIWVHALGGAITDNEGSLIGLEGTCQNISARKKAEEARREAQNRLQKLASRVPGVVYQFRMRPDGTSCLPYASDGLKKLYGVTPAEVAEDSSKLFELDHPDDHPEIINTVEISRRLLSPWLHEFRLLLPDGTQRWIYANANPEREADGSTLWHGYLMDVTERKRTEETLRWNQSLLQMMSNSSPLGFLVVDNRTDAILHFNSRFCEIWGIEHLAAQMHRGELNNNDIIPHCLPLLADVPAFADSCKRLQDEANRITLEDEIAFINNRTVRRFSTQIRDDSDHYYGRFYIFEDITTRKQAEAERNSLQAQLRESQKMEAIGTLAGGIAHDFNNILTVILGNVELAGSVGPESSLLGSFLEDIKKAGVRARELVQQILSFSRRQPTKLKPISLSAVVLESASLLKATLPARLTLDVECDDNLPDVMADATQLEQVIINLVSNSMQAIGTEPGRVSIRLDSVLLDRKLADTNSTLRKHSEFHSRLLRLVIRDTGPGMSSAVAERIFEPFFTTKPVGKGTGLGLAVVHGIVNAHDGCIVVESQEGHGTSFTIYLLPAPSPMDWSKPPVVSGENSVAIIAQPAECRIANILFLDDNEDVLRSVQGLLEIRGYHVTAFANQQDAVSALQHDPFAFDVVITDYNMPGMSGLDIARLVRQIRPGLPVAVTSGFVDEELQINAADAGAAELISKPFTSSELFKKVERLVAIST